jgi:hypothetical protein
MRAAALAKGGFGMIKIPTLSIIIVALAVIQPGFAASLKSEDDYVACLIGQSAVALKRKGVKDAKAAQARAYKLCKFSGKLDQQEAEGLGDFVSSVVLELAKECLEYRD